MQQFVETTHRLEGTGDNGLRLGASRAVGTGRVRKWCPITGIGVVLVAQSLHRLDLAIVQCEILQHWLRQKNQWPLAQFRQDVFRRRWL